MRRTLPIIYLALNVICALVVLRADHHVAAVMAREERVAPDGVDGITFFAMSAPSFLIGLLLNVAWTGKAVVDGAWHLGYGSFGWLGGGVAVWVAALLAIRLF